MPIKYLKNLDIKIVLFCAAILLWLFVASGQNRVDFFPGRLFIEAQGLGEGLAPIFEDDSVRIKVSAPKNLWKEFNQDNFLVYVDTSGEEAGTYELKVSVSSSMPGVQILDINPSKVLVRIEPAIEKTLPINIKTLGSLPDGFSIGEIKYTPKQFVVLGASSTVDDLAEVTATLSLDGEQQDIDTELEVAAHDDEGNTIRHLRISPKKVSVNAKIVKGSKTKLVGIKPKFIGDLATGYWLSAADFEPELISVSGSPEKLINLDSLSADVDVGGLSESFTKKVALNLPSGVLLAPNESKLVTVKIQILPQNLVRTVSVGVAYNGLTGRGLSVSSTSPKPLDVRIVLSGSASILSSLSSSNVVLNLNLYDKGVGDHNIELTKSMFSIPPGVQISSFLPSHISLTISEI
jgi:YbbR domain-containing protein